MEERCKLRTLASLPPPGILQRHWWGTPCPGAALRLRYFSAQPITDDGSVLGPSSTLGYAQFGKQLHEKTRVSLDIFNLLNEQVNDIAYDYTYQVTPTSAPQTGLVVKPAEPREVRISLVRYF